MGDPSPTSVPSLEDRPPSLEDRPPAPPAPITGRETCPEATAAREAEEESHWLLSQEQLQPRLAASPRHWWPGGK